MKYYGEAESPLGKLINCVGMVDWCMVLGMNAGSYFRFFQKFDKIPK